MVGGWGGGLTPHVLVLAARGGGSDPPAVLVLAARVRGVPGRQGPTAARGPARAGALIQYTK